MWTCAVNSVATHTDTLYMYALLPSLCDFFVLSLECALLSIVKDSSMQTVGSCFLTGQWFGRNWPVVFTLLWPRNLVMLLEQTASPCDPNMLTVWLKSEYQVSQTNHFHCQHGIVPLSSLQTDKPLHHLLSPPILCFIFYSSASYSGLQGFWKLHQAW